MVGLKITAVFFNEFYFYPQNLDVIKNYVLLKNKENESFLPQTEPYRGQNLPAETK